MLKNKKETQKTKPKTYCILHNIRSVHNVGSFFRTAEASGVDKIYFTGYTPCPKDRFGKKRQDVSKVALGAEEIVSWEDGIEIKELIYKLKKDGVIIVAVEQDEKSISYKEIKKLSHKNTAFIFGNETDGIEKSILDMCDYILEIPMSGKKESINVSVAGGVILFERRDY
ncbi:RNA methyltransferase [Candidatus Campbellbacteria bacterium CG22_combo_CG10-13_8_21_14_all_36_13]|uniref:RNA methyltransferase n=1 Tax=Candidatus Campbellbacteria bacterium CG22_combo_CG10-13_8_21_14_all_36_13 TaxID=1974529 RepID=A0A2H0DYK7_9BACT|nr:MAG: RNA methyltransferase [Candidatus Campbellbacteria bacterium CG22_combo_CG10-13_8_21_14_all_36_13]